MTKYPLRLWICALLLGLLFDYLFWGKPFGLNFALFLAACLMAGLVLLLPARLAPARQSLVLVAPLAFFAVTSFTRREPLTLALAFACALFCLGLLAGTWLGGRWVQYGLGDYLRKGFQLIGSLLTLPDDFNRQVRKERAASGLKTIDFPVRPVIHGLVIAFPVLALFTYLFSSADLVFEQQLEQFFLHLSPARISQYLLRAILVGACAYVVAGAFLHAGFASSDEGRLLRNSPGSKRFLGFTEAAVVLSGVIVLFTLFVGVQFRYFFGGQSNIGGEGFTYSEYARRGFNELVVVAFLSLLLSLGLSSVTSRIGETQRHSFSMLSVAVLGLVLVILISAYQRLSLAIDWHGYSRLRLYPRVFLIWVAILFVTVVILEIAGRERHFALAAVLATLGFAVTLSLVNVDASIVRYNIFRAAQGRYFNVNYLSSLTTDALPPLAAAFQDPALPAAVREGAGAALLCYDRSELLAQAASGDWRSLNLSNLAAVRALNAARDQFAGFRVNVEGTLIRVGTPGNDWYECAR